MDQKIFQSKVEQMTRKHKSRRVKSIDPFKVLMFDSDGLLDPYLFFFLIKKKTSIGWIVIFPTHLTFRVRALIEINGQICWQRLCNR